MPNAHLGLTPIPHTIKILGERFCLAVKLIEPAAVGSNPDKTILASVQRVYMTVTQTVRGAWHSTIVVKGLCPAIKIADATFCSNPEPARSIFMHPVDDIVAERLRIVFVMLITGDTGSVRAQLVESAPRSQPKVARTVLEDGSNRIVAEAGWIIGVMPVADTSYQISRYATLWHLQDRPHDNRNTLCTLYRLPLPSGLAP